MMKRFLHKVLAASLTLGLIAGTVLTDVSAVYADEYDDAQKETQNLIDSLASDKESALAAIEDLKEQAGEQSAAYEDYSAKLSSITDEVDYLNYSMAVTAEEMTGLTEEMAEVRERQQTQYEDMKKRVQYSYEQGRSNMWITLLTSDNFAQFLNRAEYYAMVTAYDKEVIEAYEEVVQEKNAKQDELQAKQDEMDGIQSDLDTKKSELNQLTKDAKAALNGTEGQIADAEEDVDEYDKQIEELQQRMVALQYAQAQAQAEMARQIAEQEAAAQAEAERQATEQAAAGDGGENAEGGEGTEGGDAGGDAGSGGDSGGTTETTPTTPTYTVTREYTAGPVSCSTEELYLLAATIQAEADNQSYEGKLAVGSVIANRVLSSKFPGSVYGVITQSGQFASYSSGLVQKILERGPNATCLQVASQVVAGTRNGDWLFFMTQYYADYFGITGYTVIGDHVFFYKWGAN